MAGQHARSYARGLATRMLVIVSVALAVLVIAWAVLGLRGLPLIAVELAAIGVIAVRRPKV